MAYAHSSSQKFTVVHMEASYTHHTPCPCVAGQEGSPPTPVRHPPSDPSAGTRGSPTPAQRTWTAAGAFAEWGPSSGRSDTYYTARTHAKMNERTHAGRGNDITECNTSVYNHNHAQVHLFALVVNIFNLFFSSHAVHIYWTAVQLMLVCRYLTPCCRQYNTY